MELRKFLACNISEVYRLDIIWLGNMILFDKSLGYVLIYQSVSKILIKEYKSYILFEKSLCYIEF